MSTTRSRSQASNRGFTIFVTLSFAIHGTLIGGVVFAQYLKPAPPPVVNSMPVQLVRLGKKRDPKMLPRLVGRRPPPPTEGIALDNGNKPKKPSRKRPTRRKEPELSAAAKRLLESTNNAAIDRAMNSLDEPEGDPNGDPNGTTTDATNIASGYVAEVIRALKSNYKLPQTIAPSQRRYLSAEVLLYVEANGRISKYDFVKKHSNQAFMGALESMLKTLQLPPPPRQIAKEWANTGVVVRFKPSG